MKKKGLNLKRVRLTSGWNRHFYEPIVGPVSVGTHEPKLEPKP